MSLRTPSLATVSLGERIERKPSRTYTQNFKDTADSEAIHLLLTYIYHGSYNGPEVFMVDLL